MNSVVGNFSRDAVNQKRSNNERRFVQQTEAVTMTDSLPDESADPSQSLDLVRKILFGEQFKQAEKRQASLENYLQDSVVSVNKEACEKIDALKVEFSVLTGLFEEEVRTRKMDMVKTQENISRIEQNINKLGHQMLKKHSEIDERLGAEKHRLDTQMRDWRQEILQQLQDATHVLEHEKADRQSIAVLLSEMAEQLVADEPEAGYV